MTLNDNQAKDKIRQPKNKSNIDAVKKYESQLRVYTEELDDCELMQESYWNELNAKMKMRSDKKFGRISQFMRFPLPIVQITDSILNDYFKVFEGKNRFFNVNANRDIETLKKWLNDNKPQMWIEKEAKIVLKNKPCSIVVVDRMDNGTPYLINVGSDRIIDTELNNDGMLEYVVFVHSIEMIGDKKAVNYSVYDDTHYRVFQSIEGQESLTMIKVVAHNLGYCPATFFISTQSNNKNPFKRRVAFGPSLSKLEDWTIFDIFRNYVDHYVPFPITEAPIKKCANNLCRGGKVAEEQVINHATNEKRTVWSTCQVCEGKDLGVLIGPGAHFGIKLQGKKDLEDGSGKFKMHFPDTANMKYVPEKLDDLELEIRYKTVGISSVLQSEAVNEMQVKGSFASMESILLRNKNELDILYKWIVKTVGNLMYSDVQLSIDANFGTEFYLMSEEQLQTLFDNSRKIGLPKSEQILIYEQLIDTKYKGNPEKVARQKLLLRLDPLPLYSEKESIEMYKTNVIDDVTLNYKINFYKFVTRFEDENAVITEFGSNLEMRQRIEIITKTLKSYNDENIASKQPPTSPNGTEGS